MSGHNKWSKIKHKKAATDAKKSKEFSKLGRLITIEARLANGNIDSPALKLAIERAKKANMPNDNIERAVKKATETGGGSDESIIYEMYGPGGVAIVISILTDNRNRTAAEIKHLLSKLGYELSKPGAALWAFEKIDGEFQANTTTPISAEESNNLNNILEALEGHDDVSAVYTNLAKL